jgi:hypothetical protein
LRPLGIFVFYQTGRSERIDKFQDLNYIMIPNPENSVILGHGLTILPRLAWNSLAQAIL